MSDYETEVKRSVSRMPYAPSGNNRNKPNQNHEDVRRVDVYLHVFLNLALDEASLPVLYSHLVDKPTGTRKFTFIKINFPLLALSQKRHQYFRNKL
jgi:hypothetical protein